jgi:CheY-like chemotaxis protein
VYDLSSWNVLVVDDEPDNLGVIELVLNFYEAKVRTAVTAIDCLSQMDAETPTLLLVDIQMPVMDGFDLLKKVRDNPAWQAIPVIAITAHAMTGDHERIIAAGFDGYIPKPISAMSLVSELQAFIDTKVSRS